ncbi:MAG TPA: pitrilysin family protein, partial [Caulobacteraceae bacterium]|nr:pitrilysin family protein [Caulobacteraceae bacterium]
NVTVQVWYGVGAKNDPPGRSGFAHLFEHMMFKATRDMPPENMDRLTEDVGGMNNAFTQDDTTAFYEVIPAADLQRLLWAEGERMSSLVVDKANFDSERQVVEEELRQRVLASPYGRLFYYVLPENSFAVHPYHRSAIGSIEDLDAASLDDVQTFHATYYRPDDATLVVVGNYDPAQLDAWIEKYLGVLKNPPTPLPQVTAVEPPRTGPKNVTTYAPNVPLPAVALTWLAPKASDPDAPALQVLDAILTAGKSSRAYDSLVYEKQIAAQVLSQADLRAQLGVYYLGAIVAAGHTPDEAETALRAQVAALRDKPVTPEELEIAKTQLLTNEIRQRETIDGRANELAAAQVIEGDAARANSDIVALAGVTAADVQRVAQTYLADDRRVAIHYLPESMRPAGAQQAAAAPPPVASKPYTGPVAALAPEGQREAPPPIGAQPAAILPSPAERTLPNGLRVIVARSTDLPLVAAALTFEAGAASDPAKLSGDANLTAALSTEGTATRSARDIARQSEALGANLAASSSWESSSLGFSVMPAKLPSALAIMADVAHQPTFAADELERARKEALDDLEVAYGEPGQVAGFANAPVVYAGTSFAHAADGTPASLKRLTREDLAQFHDRYWRPDNAILVLTGDIAPEDGFALAAKAFGGWAKPGDPPPPPASGQPSGAPRNVVIDLPGTGQAAVTLTEPAIPRSDPRYYQSLVANAVLGGGYSARLNEEIRIKRGLSYGAGSSLTARRTLGAFTAQAQTKNEAAPQVADLIRQSMAGLADAPATAEELAARKSSLVGDYGRGIATAA